MVRGAVLVADYKEWSNDLLIMHDFGIANNNASIKSRLDCSRNYNFHEILGCRLAHTFKGFQAAIVRALGAVSYTHLDVYKRQAPGSCPP